MSQYDEYQDDVELADFIVADEPQVPENVSVATDEPEFSQEPDRLSTLNTTRKTNESETSRVLRAHISVLVSALGGPDHTAEKPVYKLGHDALACLKDLKRWIRAVDEKNGTSDVALACAECGLVNNDLTVILCQWDKPPAGVVRSRTTEKVMLACLELLVLLTWPTEVNRNTLLKDYAAKTSTRRAQLSYKHHILTYMGGRTLKAVIRLGLSALKIPKDDREPRDLSILRLILFFIRNILYIEPLPATKGPKAITNSSSYPNGMNPEDVALPAVIQAFDKNNVFLFLTTIAHSVSGDINDESFGLLSMECLSLLTRGVMTKELFSGPQVAPDTSATTVPPASAATGLNLSDLLSEEDKRKKRQTSSMSSRHGRFGTLLSIQNSNNASYFTVSGQKALGSAFDTLEKLDKSKKWHKTTTFKYDSNNYVKKPVHVLGSASKALMSFVNMLLTSGSFGNLLLFVGRHLTNLANDSDLGRKGLLDAIDGNELASYFLTIAWFFRFKRERNEYYAATGKTPAEGEDGLDYGSVGAALSEINFILLISYFRSAYEAKDYDSLHVAMVCFREMLLISNSIFSKKRTQSELALETENDVNEDRELAEGIIRKLFSQKQFLDICVNIPKTAAKHSPEYLGVVVSVVHILLKSFETLANEDVHLFIKTRRRMRKLENRSGLNHEMDRAHLHLIDRGSDEEDDEEEIRYITQERKLDYKNVEVRFFHAETVSAHIEYLSKYEDLSPDEIKKAISFFHRLFVVRKDFSALYRMDFMLLIYKLQGHLPRSSSIRRHVDEFIVYFMKKFKTALTRFPTALEVLFPRFDNIEMKGFLSTGDLEVHSASKKESALPRTSYFDEDAVQPRAAPAIQFIETSLTLDEQIGILTYHLVKRKNSSKILQFLAKEFGRISALADSRAGVLSLRLNLGQRRLIISDPHLRLLLDCVGFKIPFLQNDETTLKDNVSGERLSGAKASVEKWLSLHETGVGDIEPFLDQTQRLIFSKEELDFGIQALADLRASKPVDAEKLAELDIDDSKLHLLMGLAKRKEYDEEVASRYYADEEYASPPSDHDDDLPTPASKRRSRRMQLDSDSELELASDDEGNKVRVQKRKRAPKATPEVEPSKSAEMVNDSDDESDDERNQEFFQKEERLRQLISKTGGIVDKEQLQLFRDSWSSIVQSTSSTQVQHAITKASSLFVDDDDEELGQIGDVEPSNKRSAEPETFSRKRRAVIDDDEDD